MPSTNVAVRESLTGHIRLEDNPANLPTKVITTQKRWHLVTLVLYGIYDEDTSQSTSSISWTGKPVPWLWISVHGYMFEGTRKLWPWILFVFRESEQDTSWRWGAHACVGWELLIGASEGLHMVVCGIRILVGESALWERVSLADCCFLSWSELWPDHRHYKQNFNFILLFSWIWWHSRRVSHWAMAITFSNLSEWLVLYTKKWIYCPLLLIWQLFIYWFGFSNDFSNSKNEMRSICLLPEVWNPLDLMHPRNTASTLYPIAGQAYQCTQ